MSEIINIILGYSIEISNDILRNAMDELDYFIKSLDEGKVDDYNHEIISEVKDLENIKSCLNSFLKFVDELQAKNIEIVENGIKFFEIF